MRFALFIAMAIGGVLAINYVWPFQVPSDLSRQQTAVIEARQLLYAPQYMLRRAEGIKRLEALAADGSDLARETLIMHYDFGGTTLESWQKDPRLVPTKMSQKAFEHAAVLARKGDVRWLAHLATHSIHSVDLTQAQLQLLVAAANEGVEEAHYALVRIFTHQKSAYYNLEKARYHLEFLE